MSDPQIEPGRLMALFTEARALEQAIDELLAAGVDRQDIALVSAGTLQDDVDSGASADEIWADKTAGDPVGDPGEGRAMSSGVAGSAAGALGAAATLLTGGGALAALAAAAAAGLAAGGIVEAVGHDAARDESPRVRHAFDSGGVILLATVRDGAVAARAQAILGRRGADGDVGADP